MRPLWFSFIGVLCAACQLSSAQTEPGVVTAPGRIEPVGGVLALGTAATGVVAELLIREGEWVAAGQLLLRVECENIQRELDTRRADLAAAEAVLSRLVHGSRPEEIAIGVANVGFAQARSEEAQISLHRALSLREGTTITTAQLDQSKRDARVTAAQLDEARARLALLQAGSREEDIAQGQASRDASKTLVEEAAVRLSYCSVRAPSDGIVLSIHVSPGQFVSAAIPATLVRFADYRNLRVRAEVAESDVSKLCLGQGAVVSSEQLPGTQLKGVLQSIGVELHSGEGTRPVRDVLISIPESKWPIGLRVSLRFAPCPGNSDSKSP